MAAQPKPESGIEKALREKLEERYDHLKLPPHLKNEAIKKMMMTLTAIPGGPAAALDKLTQKPEALDKLCEFTAKLNPNLDAQKLAPIMNKFAYVLLNADTMPDASIKQQCKALASMLDKLENDPNNPTKGGPESETPNKKSPGLTDAEITQQNNSGEVLATGCFQIIISTVMPNYAGYAPPEDEITKDYGSALDKQAGREEGNSNENDYKSPFAIKPPSPFKD